MRLPLRPIALTGAILMCALSCTEGFDATRIPRPYEQHSTLGQEVFAVLCDRVGASVLTEDIDGRSYVRLCHADKDGNYVDNVDSSLLPPANGVAAIHRNLAIAKLEKMAERREEFILAVDALAPDGEVDDPYVPHGPKGAVRVRLYDALAEFIMRLDPLYHSNPLEAVGGIPGPLLPASTQSVAEVLGVVERDQDALDAMAFIGGRKGYRAKHLSLGVVVPALRYPDLRDFLQNAVQLLSPGGAARQQYIQLVDVAHEELRTSAVTPPLSAFLINNASGIAQPNRPRDNYEILQNVLLATDPSFAGAVPGPHFAVMRDYRGVALVTGSAPGIKDSVPAPFADQDGDGLADVDRFSRYIGLDGDLVAVDTPFKVSKASRVRDADEYGRALLSNGQLAYQYVDITETLVASLLKDVGALFDPDPENGRETAMYALAGAPVLFGDRVPDMAYTYGQGDGAKTVKYTGFDADTSPIVDLVHAVGQVLAHPQSDDFLVQLIDLFENHPNVMARVVGVALEMKSIADEHPEAGLKGDSFFWDHLISVLEKVVVSGVRAEDPDAVTLLEEVLMALTNEDSLGLGSAYSKFMTYRDVLGYNPQDINGPAYNYTTKSVSAPSTPVDRSLPATGDNMSMFHRSMQIVYDSTGTTACNKPGALFHILINVVGISWNLTYPTSLEFVIGCPTTINRNINWCDVYRINDLTQFYLQSVVEGDPKLSSIDNKGKAKLIVQDKCLTGISDVIGISLDDTFELSSGIDGLTTRPTHQALNRLVFFGATSTSFAMPDLDPYLNSTGTLNQKVNRFISGMQEPMGTPLCPKNSMGVNVCTSLDTTIRVRDPGVLFLWEQFGFVEANRPLLYAFYKHDREDLFADLVDVVYFHLPASDHGSECAKTGSWDRKASDFNPRYCAESGVVKYEPMMAEQLQTDLLPAVQAMLKVVAGQQVDSNRYRGGATGRGSVQRRGTEVMATMTRVLFDPVVSSQNKVAYRDGRKTTVWNDGVTKVNQTTPFYMLAEALNGFDARFATAKDFTAEDRADRQAQWKKARSQLVDQFMAVEGKGTAAHFRNPAIPKAIAVVLRTLREQLNAHCPDREKGVECTWAKRDLSDKVAEVISDPLFAASIDLVDELRRDPKRTELAKFVRYLLDDEQSDESLRLTLSTAIDLLLILRDTQTIPSVFNVVSSMFKTADEHTNTGMADIALQVLNVLSRDPDEVIGLDDPLLFDRYRVFDHMAPNLVEQIYQDPLSDTVLEVLVDVLLDVHRLDSLATEPMAADDYRAVADVTRRFLTDETRGLEQLYELVRRAKERR
ncbi:MAG: hypothetical protein FWD57_05585 [Polyangiaceae bacterium]|nr:hypothetical protein [Polyangiaceae bacterium]